MMDKKQDTNLNTKNNKRDAIKAARVKRVAEIVGCSTDTVYAVLAADRENAIVEDVYFQIAEADVAFDNLLKQEVRRLVTF